MSEAWRNVRLPEDLCASVEKRYGQRFQSLEELLVFVLKDLAKNDVNQLDQREQDIVEQRLKELGYL
jgi:hypothetical protein